VGEPPKQAGDRGAGAAFALGKDPTRIWLLAVAATVAVQTATAFMIRLIPTLGPVIAERSGFPESHIGYFAALNTVGSIAFLAMGVPLMRRLGSLRALQVGIGLAAIGSLFLAVPSVVVVGFACFLIGLGYGPSAPAGTDILHRFAPPQHRALIFSIKQAGVPLGGVFAGLILPGLAQIDLRLALVCAAGIAIALAALTEPARGVTDCERDATQPLTLASFFAVSNLVMPVRSALATGRVALIALAGSGFAVAQGAVMAYHVTFLVSEIGYSLVAAGSLSALMHVVGIGGRVLCGWLSDRLGSGLTTLRILSLASGLTLLAFASFGRGSAPVLLTIVSGLAGLTVMSWNGVLLSELSRHAPAGKISEVASGATLLTFLGYILGPAGFALLLWASDSWPICFAATGATVLAAQLLLGAAGRR
jgi:MFS family permease